MCLLGRERWSLAEDGRACPTYSYLFIRVRYFALVALALLQVVVVNVALPLLLVVVDYHHNRRRWNAHDARE